MSGLAKIWSLSIPLPEGAPRVPNYDIWVVNTILLNRVIINTVACQTNAVPRSETRLRDEVMIPLYSFQRNLGEVLKSSARERGLTVPAFPAASADWSEEVTTDHKALAAQLHPHMAEPSRVSMDWNFDLRDQDPRAYWASEMAAMGVALDLFIQAVGPMGGVMGSEWGPFIAQTVSDELKGIVGAMGEELLRIRAQPGSGWNEEEAKRLAKVQLRNAIEIMTVGT